MSSHDPSGPPVPAPAPTAAEPLEASARGGNVQDPAERGAGPAMVELDALLGRGTRYQGKLYFEGRVRI